MCLPVQILGSNSNLEVSFFSIYEMPLVLMKYRLTLPPCFSPIRVHGSEGRLGLFLRGKARDSNGKQMRMQNAVLGLQPRTTFSRPRSQFLTIRTDT